MSPMDIFLLVIVLFAALGVLGAVKRWYRSCEEKYSPLIDRQPKSTESLDRKSLKKASADMPPALSHVRLGSATPGVSQPSFAPRHLDS